MFMRIVQQVNGIVQGLYTQAYSLVMGRLLPNVKQLLANTIQALQDVASQLVKAVQKLKLSLVALITREASPKQELSNVQQILTAAGQQFHPPVSQTPQPASPTQKAKHRHAERTKSGKFAPKGTGVAQTPTAAQSQGRGRPRKTVANQLRQHATQAPKKGN